jgi:3-oxoacyl-[acyl-carrier protein] reductase
MSRVCLITGASRGIGRATAIRLAQDGLDVVINYHRRERDAREVAKRVEELGQRALVVQADVASYEDVEAMVSMAVDCLGSIDVLVNNAGIYERTTLEDLSLDGWRRTLDVNLTGAFNCIKAVLPSMKKLGWGRIINISSQIAIRGTDHGADYAASKAGLLGLTRAAALELARFGITVNAIAPGTVETDIIAHYTEEDRRLKAQRIPLGRIGSPEEIASAVSFLASDDASYITGATLHVNGGGLIV